MKRNWFMGKLFQRVSVKTKFMGLATLVVSSILVFFTYYYPGQQAKLYERALWEKFEDEANVAAFSLGVGIATDNFQLIKEASTRLKNGAGYIYMVILDSTGNTLASDIPKEAFVDHLSPNSFSDTPHQQPVVELRVPITYRAKQYGTLVLGFSTREIDQQISEMNRVSYTIAIAALLLTAILMWVVSTSITKPIVQLAQASKRIASGQLSDRVKVKTHDEVGALGEVFNEMTDSLQRTYRTLDDVKRFNENIVASIPSGLVVFNTDHKVVSVNRSFREMCGLSSKAVEGVPVDELLKEVGMPAHIIDTILSGARFDKLEVECNAPTDVHKNMTVTLSLVDIRLREDRKDEQQILLEIDDISERKRAEAAAKESEDRYRQVIEDAAEVIYSTDLTGKFTYANPAAQKIVGYSLEELTQLRYTDVIVPEYRRKVSRIYIKQFLEKEPTSYAEFPFQTKHGELRWFAQNATLEFDDGKVVGFHVIARDITERRLAEEKLRQSEEQFRLITENVADMIVVLDLDGRRIYNSPSYGELVGDVGSLRGTDSFQDIHPEDRERIKQLFQETIRIGVGQRAEYRFIAKNGIVRFIESQGSVIRDESGKPVQVVVVSRDITEKKRFEQRSLRAQRMESIGTLAGGMAHDLNNVLAPIVLSLEILRSKLPDEQSRKLLASIQTSAERGANLIKQVLSFARGIEGERAIVQLRHLVAEVEKITKDTFPKSIFLRIDIPKDLWTVSADVTQLHQVLMNLFVNARDAMPDGGEICIKGENVVLDDQFALMHPDAMEGSYVLLSVMDAGIGIPPTILDKIFDPFFTTKDIGKGTGIGLSTVQTIVKSHGGFVDVYSEVGRGTTFKVYLPASERAETVVVKKDATRVSMGHGEVILVVDDEEPIRDVTKATLESNGYKVLTAGDGTEAITAYTLHKDNIRAVVTDMMMPYMDGAATIRALRKINPLVKIIAVSGLVQDGHGTVPVEGGKVTLLRKPFTSERLLSALDEVLNS